MRQVDSYCGQCGQRLDVPCSCKIEPVEATIVVSAPHIKQTIIEQESVSLWCPKEKKPAVAVIFGVTGQDGTYLAEELLRKDYHVVGISRRSSDVRQRLEDQSICPYHENFTFEEGDITDMASVMSILQRYKPNHVYNLAAQSHVQTSFSQPLLTFDVTAKGAWNILEAIRIVNDKIRYYQASSSEMFGDRMSYEYDMYCEDQGIPHVVEYKPIEGTAYQDENTPMRPQSPYAVAKLAAHHLTRLYREAYGIFACSGILFNHESPRRGEKFVTRKICKYVGYLKSVFNCSQPYELLYLGNLDSKRDWGHARDYCRAMIMMLEHAEPDDYVIATGETHTVRDFLVEAFKCIGIEDYTPYVKIDESLKRPAEVPFLRGKPNKAEQILGWKPEVSFKALVKEMVQDEVNNYIDDM